MATPKKRTSSSKTRMRRSHIKLAEINYGKCDNCGSFKLPHHICPSCGFYAGRQVLAVKSRRADVDEGEQAVQG